MEAREGQVQEYQDSSLRRPGGRSACEPRQFDPQHFREGSGTGHQAERTGSGSHRVKEGG